MPQPQIDDTMPWAPHPDAAPVTERTDDQLVAAANGTRTCSGGWLIRFPGITGGQAYRIRQDVRYSGVAQPRDSLESLAVWGEVGPEGNMQGLGWDYLLPNRVDEDQIRFERLLPAPDSAKSLTVRCALRWTATGRSEWSLPTVAVADAPPARPPVKVSVVTGHAHARRGPYKTVEDNVRFYAGLCEAACAGKPQLIVLPEIALQWGLSSHPAENAVPAPGPETDVFSRIAAENHVRILLGMHERDGDAVHNSAVLIGPSGEIDGKYRKVHLAVGGETSSGVLPGDSFPVFETEIGRIGCNICMDSSAAESSRMVGLNGADFLLLPIMGDHRASRWNPGSPIFNESRWTAIMRTRAMDNQLCMVVARNTVQGSCIIDRRGDILAWNEGDQDFIEATVHLDDGYRTWNGGCFRDVNWMQRRPHVYGAFVEPDNLGSLR